MTFIPAKKIKNQGSKTKQQKKTLQSPAVRSQKTASHPHTASAGQTPAALGFSFSPVMKTTVPARRTKSSGSAKMFSPAETPQKLTST